MVEVALYLEFFDEFFHLVLPHLVLLDHLERVYSPVHLISALTDCY